MRIPEQMMDQILKRNDIVNVVSEYVSLEKKGKNYFGICPFHDEKTPSFSVSPDKQIFHCFSCGEGGNVIRFIEKKENLSFQESALKLAAQADIDVSELTNNAQHQSEAKYFKLNQFVSDYYQFALENTNEGQVAKAYLNKRGITDEIIRKFKIGLAPASVDSLYQALKANGFDDFLMLELGHVIKGQNKFYDKFKNRIMFPIHDEYGNIVGFSGRLYLENDTQDAKYMNTQETPVFKKNEILYYMNVAKNSIKQAKQVILHEGFMDVIASSRSGIDYAVATMGTALTQNHIRLLKRYTHQVVICYDGDRAGIEATKRAMELLRQEQMNISVVELPNGLDPDDYVKQYGEETFREYIQNKQKSDKEYLYDLYMKDVNLSQIPTVEAFKKKIFALLKTASKTEYELFIRKMSNDINVSPQTLEFDFDRYSSYHKNTYQQKHLITEQDIKTYDITIRKVIKSRPSQRKVNNAEITIIDMMLMDRLYNIKLNREVAVNFQNEWHRMLSNDLYGYYNRYNDFDYNTFVMNHIETKSEDKRNDYYDFFQTFYEIFQKKLKNYQDIHFDQAIAVMKNEILASYVIKLKGLLDNTVEPEKRDEIGQKILENFQLMKQNNTSSK
jgi:DNA primase